ncbi:MAG TPA: tripartite tricarboxylate transporter substrate binding protein [Sphaerochaeta sp.]|nr:tripartite tricarboxylate transporter substrate binding protein [Sphaerochaeta sp.]
MKRTVLFLTSVLIILGLGTSLFAGGATETIYPDPEKNITVVVPHAAGGSTDLIFRALADEMKKASGVNFLVTNITGAGSATGANEVINSPADGYMFLGAGTHTTAATMQGLTSGYKDLDYVASLNWDPFIVAVRNDKPWKSFEELVKDAASRPGKISLGNAGMGGATGVASVGLNLAFDKSFNVTPFNGGADLIASVLGGHCDVGIFSQSEVVANSQSFRPLVILTEGHSSLASLASVPTLAEAGYPGITIPGGSFRSVMVKKGTSAEVKKWLADTVDKAFHSAAFEKFQKDNGLIPAFYKLDAFAEYDKTIIADYEVILKEAGLYAM